MTTWCVADRAGRLNDGQTERERERANHGVINMQMNRRNIHDMNACDAYDDTCTPENHHAVISCVEFHPNVLSSHAYYHAQNRALIPGGQKKGDQARIFSNRF